MAAQLASAASSTGRRARPAGASAPAIPIPTVAMGLRAHSGWAVMVAVASGAVLWRRRIEMRAAPEQGPCQPYHAAAEMSLPRAVAHLQSTREMAVQRAAAAIRESLVALGKEGYRPVGAAVLLGAGRPLPELSRILAAHPMIHTAEGVFFREALCSACELCGLSVAGIREREVLERCAAALRISADELKLRLAAMGRAVGRPWTQDEKLSVAAALAIS